MPRRHVPIGHPLRTHYFVTRVGCDSLAGAFETKVRVEKILSEWYEIGDILGYRIAALGHPEDFDDFDIDREFVESATNGALPVVYCSITTLPGDADAPDLGPGSWLVTTFALNPIS
jgi:hypothetical protein